MIPGVTPDETPQGGPPQEPLSPRSLIETPPPSLRVRTISAMNEKLLAQVQTADNILPKSSSLHEDRPAASASVEGRPPLPQRRPMQQEESNERQAHKSRAMAATDSETSSSSLSSLADADGLRGEALLEDSSSSLDSLTTSATKTSTPPSHVRRNTGGTIYLQSTMDNPDVQATIKAVCGVFRAHIVQSAARKSQRSPVSVAATNASLDIFRDDYETQSNISHQPLYQRSGYLGGPMNKNDKAAIRDPEVPSLEEIQLFYQDFYRRSQMEHDTIIMSLIYVERLIKSTHGALTPAVNNWRSILFSCMVLSSKVWDDLSMYNIDFSQVSRLSGTGICSFSLQRTNALELAVLTNLDFNVRVGASEYAKYYFLTRTMLSRSGMLVGPLLPLTKTQSRNLESRTVQYQNLILSEQRVRRTRSVDWASLKSPDEAEIPVLKDKLCLEQLVSMNC